MIREEDASQLSSRRSSRGTTPTRDFRIKSTTVPSKQTLKQQKAATKALMGMAKPHMLGAQNENIKRMLGMAPAGVEPGDAEILNPPAKSFMRSTSKGGLSTKETPPRP